MDNIKPFSETYDERKHGIEEALRIHEEINKVLVEKKVDRFQKYATQDSLTRTAVDRMKQNNEVARLPRASTEEYWRKWSKTHNILEYESSVSRSQVSVFHPTMKKSKKLKSFNRIPCLGRGQIKGSQFGPPNKELPPKYAPVCDVSQPPVEELYEFYKKQPRPAIPLAVAVESLSKKGGAFSLGLPRPASPLAASNNVSFCTTEELIGARSVSKKISVVFGTAERFKETGEKNKNGAYEGVDAVKTENYKGVFSTDARFAKAPDNSSPGPANYVIPQLFDNTKKVKSEKYRAIELKNILDQRSLRDSTCTVISKAAVFAFGCSFEEHKQFGLCLDGMCGKRGAPENVILLTNKDDLYRGKKYEGKTKVDSSENSLPKIVVTPLQGAIIANSFSRVATLVELGYDINEIDSITGKTAIMEAVIRNYGSLVFKLLEAYAVEFGANEVVQKEQKITSKSREAAETYKKMRLDIQDINGDTVFHFASRLGLEGITENLCDFAINVVEIPNALGQAPSDIAKTHLIFQLLTICEDKVKLRMELDRIEKEKIQSENIIDNRHAVNANRNSVHSAATNKLKGKKIRESSSSVSVRETGTAIIPFEGTVGDSAEFEAESDDFDCELEINSSDIGTYEDSKPIPSTFADTLQHSFRRHSFAVGYFIDEGKDHFKKESTVFLKEK